MRVKLLTEHHLEFLSLKGGCTGLSESTLVKMPHYWKSHVAAQLYAIDGKDVILSSCTFNSFFASNNFCRLLITFANSLDPDQDQHLIGPDLDPNSLTLC